MRIKVLELADDWSSARIRLPLNWVSRNAGGNMFGGYQASLADPVPALACLKQFPGYRVATKKLERHGRASPCLDMTYIRADGKVKKSRQYDRGRCPLIKVTKTKRPS